jgi:hypothetical protein
MTMTGRFVDHGVHILAALALLLAVMSSPIRPTRESQTASYPNYLPRNFAILETWQSGHLAMSALPSLRGRDAFDSDTEEELDADIEDELTVTSPPASVSFEVIPFACPDPHPAVGHFTGALAARPLRC